MVGAGLGGKLFGKRGPYVTVCLLITASPISWSEPRGR